MFRILALTFVLASTAGCARKDPLVAGPRDPIEDLEEVVSIRATPNASGDSTSVKVVVTVSDTTGLMLPGRVVEIESSDPSDVLEPPAGETRASGVFVSTLTGTATGTRLVTAKVGDKKASVEVNILVACNGGILVGNQPPLAASWPEDTWPVGLLTGDLDGDGSVDLLLLLVDSLTNMGSTQIVAMLDGGAGAKMESTGPGEIEIPQLADFDGDGIPDLAFFAMRSLVLLLGNGDGTFREGATYEEDPGSLHWASSVVVDGDTRAQLLVVSISVTWESRLLALRLDDEGQWTIVAERTDESLFGGRAGDFNQDGLADYVIGTGDGFTFWMRSGDGTFEMAEVVPGQGWVALVDDLDGDGTTDLLVYDGNALEAWFGRGDGTFDVRSVPTEPGFSFDRFAVGNFDDDGVPDLFATSGTQRELFVFRGLGDGRFGFPISFGNLPMPASSFAIVEQEAGPSAVALVGWSSLAILRPGGPGFPLPVAQEVGTFAIGDFDGDGIVEIASASSSSRTVSVWGHGGRRSEFDRGSGRATSLAIGDLDGDGIDEIVVLRTGAREDILSAIFPASETEYEIRLESDNFPRHLAVADFDGDGRGDIAVVGYGTTFVLLSGEDGSFRQGPAFPVWGDFIATGDFDGDGRMDLAFAGGPEFTILLGDGMGGFTVGATIENLFPTSMAAGDLDLDGTTEIVVAGGGHVEVISGLGRRGAVRTEIFEAGGNYRPALAIGDFDGDAVPDIAVSGPGDAISILWGTGDGGFRPVVHYPAGNRLNALAFGDFDGTEVGQFAALDAKKELRLLPVSCASPR